MSESGESTKIDFPNWKNFIPSKAKTPFYIYSESVLETLWASFEKNVLNIIPDLHLHFAMKANNNPDVLSFFKSKGVGLDLVSYYEADLAKKFGFDPRQCVFSGVGKSTEELERAVDENIFLINIESRSEYTRLSKIAAQKQKKVSISFRVNPDVDAKTHPYIATGLFEHKFGLDFESALNLFKEAHQDPWLVCKGISLHIGSQLFQLEALDQAITLSLQLARELKGLGLNLKYLDVGGGLGVNYKEISKIPNFKNYGEILSKHSNSWKELFGKEAHLVSECGRSLCAQAGILVTEVIGLKSNQKKNFAIVDASMTELMRPALYQAEHPMIAITSETQQITYDVVGPVCESSDVLAKGYSLPKLQEGEHILIMGCGAYGYVMANHYNGRPLPEEWWLNKSNSARLSRAREAFDS